ncbi:MAG TPA: N-acetylglucosamine-6-phosphate deacetylase [Terriglobales bacterium]|nr:N-acetylglucosamine-6-phosphate deacetylase [Terriglobales bacterium]
MSLFLFKTLYTPCRTITDAAILASDGKIAFAGERSAAKPAQNQDIHDFGDCVAVPGFFDLHFHGAAGCDVMRGTARELEAMERFLARHGTTSYLPTTVTAPVDPTLSALEQLANAIERNNNEAGRARPLGIHLEGPFLSHAKRGVHAAENLIPPTIAVFEKFWQAARGHVRMMTIAPELDGAEEVIAEATKRGVCISIGHSNASRDEAQRGIKAGARHATHTFNAMRALDHREPGILGEVLTNNQISADVIADGIHVHPSVIDLLVRAKGIENVVLITDALSAAGMPDGHYRLGTMEFELKNGRCERNGNLAGSVLTLDKAVRNLMEFAHVDLKSAAGAASTNPAKSAGVRGKGVIEPGADADFVVLTPTGEVRATVIGGTLVQ